MEEFKGNCDRKCKEKKVNLELSKCYLINVNSASTLGSTIIQSDYFVSRDV